jgi:hypothetical protein
MSSVVSAPVRKNDTPLLGRDDIANRLEVTVGSLQVTCSRLGISLRKGRRAERWRDPVAPDGSTLH